MSQHSSDNCDAAKQPYARCDLDVLMDIEQQFRKARSHCYNAYASTNRHWLSVQSSRIFDITPLAYLIMHDKLSDSIARLAPNHWERVALTKLYCAAKMAYIARNDSISAALLWKLSYDA